MKQLPGFGGAVNPRLLNAVNKAGKFVSSASVKPEHRIMGGDDDRIMRSAKQEIPSWDIPPWELPGGFRFDTMPHRGPLLRWLANVAFVCAALSFYPLTGCYFVFWIEESRIRHFFGAAAVLGLVATFLGSQVWRLAGGDLEAMRTGLIDPEGKWETKFAHDRAVNSIGLGLAAFLLWGMPVILKYFWNS